MAAGSSTLPNETVTLKLPTGEMVDAIVPGGLSDSDVKSYVQMKNPALLGAPSTGAMPGSPATQPMSKVDALGNPQTDEEGRRAGLAGMPGAWMNRPVTGKDLIPGSIVGGAAAAVAAPSVLSAGGVLTTLKNMGSTALKALPYVAASEGINYARQHLPGGKYIPPGAEMLPLFMSGGKEPEAEPKAVRPPPVGGMKAPYTPEAPPQASAPPVTYSIADLQARAAAAAEAKSAAVKIPSVSDFKGPYTPEPQPQVSSPPLRWSVSAPLEPESIAAEKYQVVPLTGPKSPAVQGADPFSGPRAPAQMEPAQSTTISQHGYHPESQTMTVQFKNGNVYEYRGVPQKVYQQYQNSESQGSFFASNIKGRYTTNKLGVVKPTPGQKVSQALGGQQ